MSVTYAMVLDGVLRKNKDQAVNHHGMFLYRSLITTGRLAILGSQDRAMDEWFLKTNDFHQHAHLITEELASGSKPWIRRMNQIGRLRQEGSSPQFVIEPDPGMAKHLIAMSVPVLLYIHPRYSAPSFRPDYVNAAKPWAELTEEIEYQERLKANEVVWKDAE